MEEMVFLNGKFMPIDEAKLSVFTPGFLYGLGLFETMRAYNNKIVYFNQHLERIKNSSKLIQMRLPYSPARLKEIIKTAVKINGFCDAYVRLTLWKSKRGADILIIVRKNQPYPAQKYTRGFSVQISSFRQNENSDIARIKTTNRLFYELSLKEAKAKGFEEAIILNNRGLITEASRSNIFLVKDKELFTPALECGCLEGITRKVILDLAKRYNIKVYEGNFSAQDLYAADEVFLTNSLMGVMPLVSVDKRKIGKGKISKITKFFMEKYSLLLGKK